MATGKGGSDVTSQASGRAAAAKAPSAVDPATGLPASLSVDEATKSMLLPGGRYDVVEMQRAAVERLRLAELRKLDKVRECGSVHL